MEDTIIVCDDNHAVGAYGVEYVHNKDPERSRAARYKSHDSATCNNLTHFLFLFTYWQIMPFGHITPVFFRLMVYQIFV